MDEDQDGNDEGLRNPAMIGVGIAIGAGLGAARFAATGNVVWLGAFIAIGVAIGAALSQARGD